MPEPRPITLHLTRREANMIERAIAVYGDVVMMVRERRVPIVGDPASKQLQDLDEICRKLREGRPDANAPNG